MTAALAADKAAADKATEIRVRGLVQGVGFRPRYGASPIRLGLTAKYSMTRMESSSASPPIAGTRSVLSRR